MNPCEGLAPSSILGRGTSKHKLLVKVEIVEGFFIHLAQLVRD